MNHGAARWQEGEQQISLLRHGHAWQVNHIETDAVMGLWAEVTGLPLNTMLMLRGPPGLLTHFLSQGRGKKAIHEALQEAVAPGP